MPPIGRADGAYVPRLGARKCATHLPWETGVKGWALVFNRAATGGGFGFLGAGRGVARLVFGERDAWGGVPDGFLGGKGDWGGRCGFWGLCAFWYWGAEGEMVNRE